MIRDDERREVARRLRELPDDSTYPDLIGAIADHDGWYAAADAADRLADLIEPGEPKVECVAEVKVDGERLEELVHNVAVELTGIDRNALLELADEMETAAARYENRPAYIDDCAYRIREALGVES